MSITQTSLRMLKYGITKARNVRSSEPVPVPVISNRAKMTKLAAEFHACGYDVANCAKRLGIIPRNGVNFWWVRDSWTPVPSDPVDTLLEVFLSGREVAMSRIAGALSSSSIDAAFEMKLIERHGNAVSSRLSLFPFYGLLIATDRTQTNTAINQVMWLYPESYLLGGIVERSPRRRALDLGTGSGVHALLASKHSETVIGVDVNPRALEFSRFNAALNGIKNVDFVLGDLFDPLDPAMTFDFLTANPPYIPDLATKAGNNFWSGGSDGTSLLRRIIEALPAKLDHDGVANIISLYPIPPQATLRESFNQWLGGQVGSYEVLDYTWPVPHYKEGFADLPPSGDRSAWRWGVVSLRRGNGWWREAAGEMQFFRHDGACSVVADHENA